MRKVMASVLVDLLVAVGLYTWLAMRGVWSFKYLEMRSWLLCSITLN